MGPDFKHPATDVPDQWSGAVPEVADASQALKNGELAHWWMVFGDPMLTSLEERAASANLDLKLAEARVRQARAARSVAAGGLGPALDGAGSYRRGRTPASGTGGQAAGVINDQYQAGFDAAWEIDIFGGQRRNLEAAGADLRAAEESRRNVLVSLMAEVATDYIRLRSCQQQLEVARKNLQAQQHSARLARQRFEAGLVSGLDVADADAQTSATAAQIPLLESEARQTVYSLSILIGQPPATLVPELSPTGEIPGAPPAVPVGLPSDLLRRRPDIRMAESSIHAATARIGAAESDLFPKFTIAGAMGYQSDNSGSLFDWANRFWSISPSVSWNLFQSGRIRANVEVQKALQEQEVIAYRQTVLNALQEVENALVTSEKEQARRESLASAVAASRKAVALSETLYTDGMSDFTGVLMAQQALYASENSLAQSTAAVSTSLVALYKALGGGWTEAPAPDASVPAPKEVGSEQ